MPSRYAAPRAGQALASAALHRNGTPARFDSLDPGGRTVSGEGSIRGARRYRVYQVVGIVLGALFLALGVAALLGGGGPIVGAIGIGGGLVVVIVSIVMMVRS